MWMARDRAPCCEHCRYSQQATDIAPEGRWEESELDALRVTGQTGKERKPKTYVASYRVAPVRAYILAKDLDIKSFADEVGINREELYRYWTKNGDRRRKVSDTSAKKLSKYTGIPKSFWKGENVTIKVTRGR